jgi:3-oxoacyl-[acyl-carrier-protein] synthase III
MAGGDIWMFTKTKVVPEIKKAIKFCLEHDLEVTGFYMHQASKVVVDGIRNELPEFVQKVMPTNYSVHGNTVSSTIPILLKEYPMSCGENKVIIFAGFGVGLSASTAVFGQG